MRPEPVFPAGSLNVPPADSPLLERLLREEVEDEAARAELRAFAEKGYLRFELGLPDFDALAERVIADLAPRYPKRDRRVMEAWTFDGDVRRIATAERALELLRRLYRREPIPFQTLNFDRGTEQAAHSDTLHFHCAPRRYMAGVWVALEDIDGDCGPLVVYPGSHRLPDLDMHDLGLVSDPAAYGGYEQAVATVLADSGIEPVELHLKKGEAVVWAANLFHGGVEVRDRARTRHSQVTHYYFEDCLYYFPMSSDPFARSMCMREVIDLRTLRFVPHLYRGRELDLRDYRYVVAYPRPLPPTVQRGELPEAAQPGQGLPPDVEERLWQQAETLRFQRENLARLEQKTRQLEALLHRTWTSLPYRFAHGVRKTWNSMRGRRDPIY